MRLLLLIILVIALSACSTTVEMPVATTAIPQEAVPTIDPSNGRLSTAQFNYQRNCAHCHGYGGEG
ncbi:MAG: hypothetical protein AAFQ07_17450, partial [Chloroflexota bacterium]